MRNNPAAILPRLQRREPLAHRLPDAVHPVLARVVSARGLLDAEALMLDLAALLPPVGMKGMDEAVELLVAAIGAQRRIVIAGDYDADGATAVAVAVLGLRALGARHVDYVVPQRLSMGYGLSPALAELAAEKNAELLVTVDNGIASLAGVARAQALGMRVIVTDHHLPGRELPGAEALVNPNQAGCRFGSKHLAGVGVMFYVLSALRARLRERGAYSGGGEPRLSELLDLVALGTVADLVRLDRNNRILVAQGLARIRAGRCRPGILALLAVAGRVAQHMNASDLGFVVAPRINAAGRLEDIRIGIECLLANDETAAMAHARELDRINRSRRELQQQASSDALLQLDTNAGGDCGLSLFDEGWHEGIVGLVASRVKEVRHRPVVAFARAQEPGMLKGSARTIEGLHLRDALAAVDSAHPGLIERFGGHAMAAGLSLRESALSTFREAFDRRCREVLLAEQLQRVLLSDGELSGAELKLETARALEQGGPWGQGLAEPMFDNVFQIAEARCVGSDERHARYRFRAGGGESLSAVDFGGGERLRTKGQVRVLYSLAINRWRDSERLELRIAHLEDA